MFLPPKKINYIVTPAIEESNRKNVNYENSFINRKYNRNSYFLLVCVKNENIFIK